MVEDNDRKLAYSVEETAQLLDCSKDLVYESIRRGEIPAVHIGRRILVPKLALEKMLEVEHKTG